MYKSVTLGSGGSFKILLVGCSDSPILLIYFSTCIYKFSIHIQSNLSFNSLSTDTWKTDGQINLLTNKAYRCKTVAIHILVLKII